MALVKSAFIELLKPGLKKDMLEVLQDTAGFWEMEVGYFLDIANEEGEPIFSEDEPWWVI